MAKTSIAQKLGGAAKGILNSLADLILLELSILGDIAANPTKSGSVRGALEILDRNLGQFDSKSIRNGLKNARRKQFISQRGFGVTKAGQKRIKNIFPFSYPISKWDGEWEIVVFDIPEKEKWKRNVFRVFLKQEGYGRLQESVWICPRKHTEEMEKEVRHFALEPYVVVFCAKKIGEEDSKKLAERVWFLSRVNEQYEQYLGEYIQTKERWEAITGFLSIFHEDPKLPQELLPIDWKGKEAFQLYLRHLRKGVYGKTVVL